MDDKDRARDTDKAPPPSRVVGLPTPREPMPTLPDGVPSDLWDEAVESERRMTTEPAPPSWLR